VFREIVRQFAGRQPSPLCINEVSDLGLPRLRPGKIDLDCKQVFWLGRENASGDDAGGRNREEHYALLAQSADRMHVRPQIGSGLLHGPGPITCRAGFMFLFFSNRLGCLGSLVVSAAITVGLLFLFGVLR
jgi:hypothetical protein